MTRAGKVATGDPTVVSRNPRTGHTQVPNWRWEHHVDVGGLDPFELRVAGWIASHTDRFREDINRRVISERTGVSTGKVSGAIKKLTDHGIISVDLVPDSRSGGERWRITFDWAVWHSGLPSSDDRSPVTTRPQPGHEVTAIEEQEKEEQLSLSPSLPGRTARRHEYTEEFLAWYRLYPNATAKLDASKVWDKLTAAEKALAMEAAPRHAAAWAAQGRDRSKIMAPDRWLRGKRWEDEVTAAGLLASPSVSGGRLVAPVPDGSW